MENQNPVQQPEINNNSSNPKPIQPIKRKYNFKFIILGIGTLALFIILTVELFLVGNQFIKNGNTFSNSKDKTRANQIEYSQIDKAPAITKTPSPTTEQLSTPGWKTFTNINEGFSIKFPKEKDIEAMYLGSAYGGVLFVSSVNKKNVKNGIPERVEDYFILSIQGQDDQIKYYNDNYLNLKINETTYPQFEGEKSDTLVKRLPDSKLGNLAAKTFESTTNEDTYKSQILELNGKIFINSLTGEFFTKNTTLSSQIASTFSIYENEKAKIIKNDVISTFGKEYVDAKILMYDDYIEIIPKVNYYNSTANRKNIYAKNNNGKISKLIEWRGNNTDDFRNCLDYIEFTKDLPVNFNCSTQR